jgi:hypothetical protein
MPCNAPAGHHRQETTLTESDKGATPATFTAPQRADDGKKAMAEYEAAALAMRVKTERLRAMRLAREAEVAKSAPKPAAKKKSTAKASGKKSADSGTLSDWLDAQERGGRRS